MFIKAANKCQKLEQSKFQEPKFSDAIMDMVDLLTEIKQESPSKPEVQL